MKKRRTIHNQPVKRILVAINIGGASGRDTLSGFFKYVNDGKKWRLKLLDGTKGIRDALTREIPAQYDGIATDYPDDHETLRLLKGCGIPVVFTHFESASRETFPAASFVRLDDDGLGAAAAWHFLKMGSFGSFVFAAGSSSREDWSTHRERGFRSILSRHGVACHTLTIPQGANTTETAAFAKRLQQLDSPTALFADWDNTAFRALEICIENGIEVPNRVSIIGTDNDEVLCRGTTPTLSSILPDHMKLGFSSAKELDRLMKGYSPRKITIRSSIREIITRDSTRLPLPAEHLIRKAKRFIEANDTKNILPADVVKHLQVSRSLADLRFRELTGKSIGQMISAARINAVMHKLRSSSSTVTEVAQLCGFSSIQALVRYFKRETGITPAMFRNKLRTTTTRCGIRCVREGPIGGVRLVE